MFDREQWAKTKLKQYVIYLIMGLIHQTLHKENSTHNFFFFLAFTVYSFFYSQRCSVWIFVSLWWLADCNSTPFQFRAWGARVALQGHADVDRSSATMGRLVLSLFPVETETQAQRSFSSSGNLLLPHTKPVKKASKWLHEFVLCWWYSFFFEGQSLLASTIESFWRRNINNETTLM